MIELICELVTLCALLIVLIVVNASRAFTSDVCEGLKILVHILAMCKDVKVY